MNILLIMETKLKNKWNYLLHAFFYKFVFGRRIPFTGKLETIVSSWEKRLNVGDVPVSRDEWENQYQEKKWKWLENLDEQSHYSVIIGYLVYLKPDGAILDVGCGEGILFNGYRHNKYSKYVGIDISESALANLNWAKDERTDFFRADAEAYTPTDSFDVIVFNETLYYFHDPLKVVKRYSHSLKEDGIFIISTFTASKRALAILRLLKTRYSLLNETTITQQSRSWICSVFSNFNKINDL